MLRQPNYFCPSSTVLHDESNRRDDRGARSVAKNNGAPLFGFLHMIERSENDSILAEKLGFREKIPRHLFQQLIAKASDDVKRKLKRERPDLVGPIQNSVTDITGTLHSKFGPASKNYARPVQSVTSRPNSFCTHHC
jgi:hypothetical protein